MTSATQGRPPNLIVARLKIEAALRCLNYAVRVQDGRLLIDSSVGVIPVLIRNTPQNGIRVAAVINLGICPDPDTDFFDFVARTNEQRSGVTVEVNEAGAVCLQYVHEFAGGIDCSRVTDGLTTLGTAYYEIREELRQRFFVHPVETDFQGSEGIE